MTYTSHGHHIPGTSKQDPPTLRGLCGGIEVCEQCGRQASRATHPSNGSEILKMQGVIGYSDDGYSFTLDALLDLPVTYQGKQIGKVGRVESETDVVVVEMWLDEYDAETGLPHFPRPIGGLSIGPVPLATEVVDDYPMYTARRGHAPDIDDRDPMED